MKTLFLMFSLAACGLAAAQSKPNPGSLWSDATSNPLLDRIARNAGDILTVIISETSSATLTAKTTAAKQDSTTVDPVRLFSWLSLTPNALTTSATNSNSGDGATLQNGRLTARVTVLVKQAHPNRTLVIEGTRTVVINKETQTFRLSGIVRRDDIRPDNTLLSEKIAEAQIAMEGKGLLNERQRRGILTRILDWLF